MRIRPAGSESKTFVWDPQHCLLLCEESVFRIRSRKVLGLPDSDTWLFVQIRIPAPLILPPASFWCRSCSGSDFRFLYRSRSWSYPSFTHVLNLFKKLDFFTQQYHCFTFLVSVTSVIIFHMLVVYWCFLEKYCLDLQKHRSGSAKTMLIHIHNTAINKNL